MYTADTLGRILDGFTAQVDAVVESESPSAGRCELKPVNGLRTEQRYVNGDAEAGRLSVTVLERFDGEQLVKRLFKLSNHSLYGGEDAPDDDELDTAFAYTLTVEPHTGFATADLVTSDNVGFKAHLAGYDSIPAEDQEARTAHIEADDSFDTERPIEPSEIELIGHLLTQVTASAT